MSGLSRPAASPWGGIGLRKESLSPARDGEMPWFLFVSRASGDHLMSFRISSSFETFTPSRGLVELEPASVPATRNPSSRHRAAILPPAASILSCPRRASSPERFR